MHEKRKKRICKGPGPIRKFSFFKNILKFEAAYFQSLVDHILKMAMYFI